MLQVVLDESNKIVYSESIYALSPETYRIGGIVNCSLPLSLSAGTYKLVICNEAGAGHFEQISETFVVK